MYLITGTRPDLAYTISFLAQFSSCPTAEHIKAAKHLFRYVNGTRNLGLFYPYTTTNAINLMLTQTLLTVLTPEDPPPVTLFYSITVVSLGFRRNKPVSQNKQLKQNQLLCPTVLAIFDGLLRAWPTFIFRYLSLCMQTIPAQISWQSTRRLMFKPNTLPSTTSSPEKLSKTTCSSSLRLNPSTTLPIYVPKSQRNLRISEQLVYWAVDNVGKC